MKKYFIKAICLTALAAVLASCGNAGKKAQAEAEAAAAAEQARLDSLKQAEMIQKQEQAMVTIASLPEEPVFDIITNYGTIKVKLYGKTPKHRENFAKLALSGYYDEILFHRVINGFMIQAGDPLSKDTTMVAKWGTGGPSYTIPAEFVGEYTHKKGALAAARRGDAANPMKESSGSQFYIVQDENACRGLNGDYTVFGETVDGLKTVDKIASVQTDQRDRPIEPVRIVTIKLDESCLPNKQ